MIITNKTGLPQPIYDAIVNDDYTKGDCDYSVSGLCRPPRIAALERQYWHVIEKDVAESIFILFGKAIHHILEKSEDGKEALVEERLYADIFGKRISGKFDRFVLKDGILQDYKITSVWKVLSGGTLEEYAAQQNIYVWLLRKNGYTVRGAQLVDILRDWSKAKARRDQGNYPVYQVVIEEVPIWSEDKVLSFIEERIKVHEEAKHLLPSCTDEERWADKPVFAVMKEGARRALKLCQTREEALEIAGDKEDHFVQVRPGEQKRCLDYCSVAKHCTQFQQIKEAA